MSDFLNQFLQDSNGSIKARDRNKRKTYDSPILHQQGNNIDVTIIVDKRLDKEELKILKKAVGNAHIGSYQVLNALQVELLAKDYNKSQGRLKSPKWSAYKDYRWDFRKYIPKWSKIICFGRSMFSLTQSNDLDCSVIKDDDDNRTGGKEERNSIVQGYYDYLLHRTYFFEPDTSCYVFPVDSWDSLYTTGSFFFQDNFEYKFMKDQFELARDYNVQPERKPLIKTTYVENPNKWLLDRVNENKIEIGIDTETKGLDPWSKEGRILCITITYDGYEGFYLPTYQIDPNILEQYLKKKLLIGTNLKYDVKWIHVKFDIPLKYLRIHGDTEQLQAVINEMQRKGLKPGAYLWTMYGGYDRGITTYQMANGESKRDYSLLPFEDTIKYSCYDPCMSFQVHKAQMKYLIDLDINYPMDSEFTLYNAYRFRIDVLNLYTEIECTGMGIHKDRLREQEGKIKAEIEEAENKLYDAFNINKNEINLGSDEQLARLIQERGWTIYEYGKKGYTLTNNANLQKWVKDGHTEASLIIKLREKEKLYSTYIGNEEIGTGIWKFLRDDGLLHPEYKSMLTLSWRHKGRNPNPQNFPSHGDKASMIRYFITPIWKDYSFLSTDFSGLQLRLGCIASGDEVMRDAFLNRGGDLHTMSAYNIFFKNKQYDITIIGGAKYFKTDTIKDKKILEQAGFKEDTKVSEFIDKSLYKPESMELTLEDCLAMKKYSDFVANMRFRAKSFNFGLLFGATAFTIAVQNIEPNWSVKECQDYIEENELWATYHDQLRKLNKSGKNSQNFTKEENAKKCLYWTVASDIRKKFFETYTGLEQWIKNTTAFAKKFGYSRSVYGSFRRLPYLMYKGNDTDKRKYSNCLNISLNSPIQTMEAYIINRWMLGIHEEVEDAEMRSKMNGQIHDAKESLVHNDEIVDYIKLVHRIGEEQYDEYDGIPLEVESNLADYWDKDQLWDMGWPVFIKDNKVYAQVSRTEIKEVA